MLQKLLNFFLISDLPVPCSHSILGYNLPALIHQISVNILRLLRVAAKQAVILSPLTWAFSQLRAAVLMKNAVFKIRSKTKVLNTYCQ